MDGWITCEVPLKEFLALTLLVWMSILGIELYKLFLQQQEKHGLFLVFGILIYWKEQVVLLLYYVVLSVLLRIWVHLETSDENVIGVLMNMLNSDKTNSFLV